jgi:hypothetical protein
MLTSGEYLDMFGVFECSGVCTQFAAVCLFDLMGLIETQKECGRRRQKVAVVKICTVI